MTDPIVKIDRMTALDASEEHGAIRSMTRNVIVTGLDDDGDKYTDYTLLTEALELAGVPKYGDGLAKWDENRLAADLILVQRNVRAIDQDKVNIELIYKNFMDIEEDLDNPKAAIVYGEITSNIQQKTSNLDKDGKTVSVAHTFSGDKNYDDGTYTQGGEFQFYEPEKTFVIKGIKQIKSPWLLSNDIKGHINNDIWAMELKYTWLCTACNWKLAHRAFPGVGQRKESYFMFFEFQFNPDGWEPEIRFIDEYTGKPPSNNGGLVAKTGYKTVKKMPKANFDEVLGFRIQG